MAAHHSDGLTTAAFARWRAAVQAIALVATWLLLAPPCTAQPWPGRDWLRETPESQGLSSRRLMAVLDRLDRPELHIDSVLIVRHGRIVFEAACPPYTVDQPHDLRSVTKSVLGTVVGATLASGAIDSLATPALHYFPERRPRDPRFAGIRIQDLMDMRTGLAWREWPYDADSDVYRMHASNDPIGFILDRPVREDPGRHFNYAGAAPELLSAIVHRATGLATPQVARRLLFEPLSIDQAPWWQDRNGRTSGESGLSLTPADLARIGLLHLRNGLWNGHRVLPAGWVPRLWQGQRPHGVSTRLGLPPAYSLLWWVDPAVPMALASGRHGQHMVLLPRQDMVLVITAKTPDTANPPLDISELVIRALLPAAAAGQDPLPADPAGLALLHDRWTRLQKARMPASQPPAPARLHQISGVTYRLATNERRLATIRVDLLPDAQSRFTLTWRGGSFLVRLYPFTRPMGHGHWVRSSATPYGVFASRSHWRDPRTLVIETLQPASANREQLELRFSEDGRMQLTVLDGEQPPLVLSGRPED